MVQDSTRAGPGNGPRSSVFPRYEQTYPELTANDIERMRRFGEMRRYADGDACSRPASRGRECSSCSRAHRITQRDGLGHVTPVVEQGPGQFRAKSASSPAAPFWSTVMRKVSLKTLLIPPEKLRRLLVAEAELGERIMRALILRRVNLIRSGTGRAGADWRFVVTHISFVCRAS